MLRENKRSRHLRRQISRVSLRLCPSCSIPLPIREIYEVDPRSRNVPSGTKDDYYDDNDDNYDDYDDFDDFDDYDYDYKKELEKEEESEEEEDDQRGYCCRLLAFKSARTTSVKFEWQCPR